MPMHGQNIVYIAVIDNTNNTIFKVSDNKSLGTNTAFKMLQKKPPPPPPPPPKKGQLIFCVRQFIFIYSLFFQ